MATDDEQPFSDLEDALKKSAAALRAADVPFLLGREPRELGARRPGDAATTST